MAEEDPGNKRRRRGDEVPPGGGRGGDPDLLSRLPDEVLRSIITLLSAADGARTQILSRRWRPLWRSAPLNLEANFSGSGDWILERVASKLSELLKAHEVPVRRFSLNYDGWRGLSRIVDPLLQSPRLQGVQEFELSVYQLYSEIPPSLLRFSHALSVLHMSQMEFPMSTTCTLSFLILKHVTLIDVKISESTLHGVLSRCPVLETLLLDNIRGASHVQISSLTLRSVGVSDCGGFNWEASRLQELVIVEAPLLERLIPRAASHRLVIRIIHAPRLSTVGYLHDAIPILQLGTLHFKKMVLVRPSDVMRSVRILGLITAPNLEFVTGVLKCFPCVEKLHIVSYTRMISKNDMKFYDPLECLDQHLKKVHIMNYKEKRPDVNFIKFFILNSRVLESMKFVVHRDKCGAKWIARQHKKLHVNDRASQGAVFEFEADCSRAASSLVHVKHIHDLDMDPFDRSLCRCHCDELN